MRRARGLLTLVLTALSGVAGAQAQQYGARVEVHAIEVSASVRDASGRTPPDLRPDDFILLEEGRRQKIIGVSYAGVAATMGEARAAGQPRGHVVIYIQQSLAMTSSLRTGLGALASQPDALLRLGDVEIVADMPHPHSIFGPSREPAAVRGSLENLAEEITGNEQLIGIRRAFMIGSGVKGTSIGMERPPALDVTEDLALADQAAVGARREWTALRTREGEMVAFLARYPRQSGVPRTLLLVTSGFDLEPVMFYAPSQSDLSPARRKEIQNLSASDFHERITKSLSASGWIVSSIAVASDSRRTTVFKPQSHDGREPQTFVDVIGNNSIAAMNRAPLVPLLKLAHATGGSVFTDGSKVAAELANEGPHVIVTYQTDRPLDDKVRHIELRTTRPGLTVRSQRWVGSGTSEAEAEATAVELAGAIAADEATGRGELPVTCTAQTRSESRGIRESDIEVSVDLTPIEALLSGVESGTLRYTVAVLAPREAPFTSTRQIEKLDFTSQSTWSCTISVRHRKDARIAVIAAESSTGAWGGCTVTLQLAKP